MAKQKGSYSRMSPGMKKKFARVMHEWGQGKLKASSGQTVKSQAQAEAIGFSEARRWGNK